MQDCPCPPTHMEANHMVPSIERTAILVSKYGGQRPLLDNGGPGISTQILEAGLTSLCSVSQYTTFKINRVLFRNRGFVL